MRNTQRDKVKSNDEGHSPKLSKNISKYLYSKNSWWSSLEFTAILSSGTALFENSLSFSPIPSPNFVVSEIF